MLVAGIAGCVPKAPVPQPALWPENLPRAVRVRIGGRELEAVAGEGTFAVRPGQVAPAPRSSGWTGADGREVRWVEAFLRGGNAWEAFGRPGIGERVEVEVVAAG